MAVYINVLLFALTFYGQCYGSEYESSGYGFYPDISGWMRLNTDPADWSTARTNCHSQNAVLLSPWSDEFISVAYDIQSQGSLETIFSGVRTTYADGALVYVDGKPTISVDPEHLAPLERCGVFFANGTTGQVHCDQQLPYICYAPATDRITESKTVATPILVPASSATLGPCGEQTLGYEIMEATGNCYKFHIDLVDNLDDAQMVCEFEGANIAEVDSGLEAQFLMEIYSIKLDYANDIRFLNFETYGEDVIKPEPEFTVRNDVVYAYHWFRRTSHFICEKPSIKPETEPIDFKPRPVIENITEPLLKFDLTSLCGKENLDIKNMPLNCEKDTVFDPEPEIKTETPENPKIELVTDTESPIQSVIDFKAANETTVPTRRSCDTSRGYTRQIFGDIELCIKRHLQNDDSMENAKNVCKSEEAKLLVKDSEVFDEVIDSWNDFYDEDTEGSTILQYVTADYAYFRREDGLIWFLCHKEPNKQSESISVNYRLDIKDKQENETGYKGDTNAVPTTEIETTETEFVTVTDSEMQFESEVHIDVRPSMLSLLALNCEEQGYQYAGKINKCYKFHEVAHTWNDAKLTCAAEEAHLAVINSNEEAQFLADLLEKYQTEKNSQEEMKDAAIGIYKNWSFDENWLTVTGEALEQTGYTSWGPNEPIPFAKFGFISRDGLLTTNFGSFEDVPFICEKKRER